MKKIVVAGMLVICSSAAMAQTALKPVVLTPAEQAALAEEASLVRDVRRLRLEAEIKKLQAESNKAGGIGLEGALAGLPAALPAANLPAQPAPALSAGPSEPAPKAFNLMSIWGVPGSYRADILINGVRNPVVAGDELSGGWKVSAITAGSVQIQRGRQRQTLTLPE